MVSLTGMQTDLMPDLSMPYLTVITTEVGASPEQVETDVTEPMESALGTINGVEIGGESEQVMEMVVQMLKALALGGLLVYLVMVAQFQSLLSPFIIIFTIPLAFTGGMLGLAAFGKSISAMSLMGFMILMGTVVNNGIVFVDYANRKRHAERRVYRSGSRTHLCDIYDIVYCTCHV